MNEVMEEIDDSEVELEDEGSDDEFDVRWKCLSRVREREVWKDMKRVD